MKRRGFTLMEIMVSSGVLLVMVIMTSLATLSYLRAYRHYTSEGLQLRQTAKTLEVLCFQLRSARSMQAPIPASLRQAPLLFEKKTREHCALQVVNGQLVLTHDKETIKIGMASDVTLNIKDGLLQISIPVMGQNPVQTAVSLRGLRR